MRSMFLTLPLLFFSALPLAGTASFEYSPDNAVIAFDFHDVIVRLNQKKRLLKFLSIAIYSAYKIDIAKNAYWIMKDAYTIKKQDNQLLLDDVLEQLVAKYPFIGAHIDDIQDAINSHEPNWNTVALIKELKERGYKIYLASNLSPKSYKVIKEKEPALFALFDDVYTAHQNKPNSDELYTRDIKPKLGYFHGFRRFLQDVAPQDAQKKIIFIDDKIKNTKAGSEADNNLVGIHFTTPARCKKQLHQLGIL